LSVAASFLLGVGVTLAAGAATGFHVNGVDFWGVLYYGRNLFADPPYSLYNGFFPIGYAFLIGQFPLPHVVELAWALNALLAGLVLASMADLVGATRSMLATVLAVMFSLLCEPVFQYLTTVGPDIGVAAFTAFAVDLLWRDRIDGRPLAASPCRWLVIGLRSASQSYGAVMPSSPLPQS
jgi:hypothetical protein